MKIVVAHNQYQQAGGEDQVFGAEAALLERRGHRVFRYMVHNDDVVELGKLALARATIWNPVSHNELLRLFARERPDVVHLHNTLPLISPAAYYAAKAAGVAVVQTLHNYRLSCVNGLLFRDGQVCEDCLGKFVPWAGVARGCYRDSRAASGAVAAMLAFHKLRRTYHNMVDAYIALTQFSRGKFLEAGFPAEKIVVKPNFVDPDPGVGRGRGGYALFVGRLSREKGLDTLLSAWARLSGREPLKIVGDGPLAATVRQAAAHWSGIEWLGHKSPREVYELMGGAGFLIFPSSWYETFGRVAVEAFAKGTPVVAANTGAVAELVEHGRTGLHFEPGNADDLAAKVEWGLSHPAELSRMRSEARVEYESKYTSERNYYQLIKIYERAKALAGIA